MIDYAIFLAGACVVFYILLKLRGKKTYSKEYQQLQPEKTTSPESDLQTLSPVIKVIFSSESNESEEFARELADMYIEERSFFYTGKKTDYSVRGNTAIEDKVYVEFEKIKFEALKVINV